MPPMVRATLQVMKLASLSLQAQTVHLPPCTAAYHMTLLVSPALNSPTLLPFELRQLPPLPIRSSRSRPPATLLHNFSASLFSNYNGSMSFHKEFCLTVRHPFSSGSDVRPLVKTGNWLQPTHSTVKPFHLNLTANICGDTAQD
ncbi:hypothetical protein NL676_005286 [Syzygium grande]|nr:hypothetical protein NL676_005286 [Syzygium grande]